VSKSHRWIVPETWISDVLRSAVGEPLTVTLLDANGERIRRWQAAKPSGSLLFFRPDASGQFGTFTPHDSGIAPGEWLILYRDV
jgi:hypothetical protein